MRLLLPLLLGCGPGPSETGGGAVDSGGADGGLSLFWVPVAGEPWSEALAGLWWSLAGLGATPDAQAVSDELALGGGVLFRLDPDRLGLRPEARDALDQALDPLREAQREQGMPWIDTGRFLQRTLYEPWVYYAVTGACADVDSWSARLPSDAPVVAITESLLTEGDRRVRFAPDPGSGAEIAWLAEEGEGGIAAGDFRPRAFEVVDLMPNGRFRYAVYDEAGGLVAGADPAHAPAGQPGKCMWCHENHLMNTVVQPDLEGHLPFAEFNEAIGAQQAMVEAERAALGGVVDWQTHAVHTWGEVLVEGFLQAPTARLAAEWGVSPGTVEAWMAAAGAQASENPEYPDWGPVWSRADADAVFSARRPEVGDRHLLAGPAGLAPLPVLPSARETPAPGAALPLAPWPHACAPTGARRARPE